MSHRNVYPKGWRWNYAHMKSRMFNKSGSHGQYKLQRRLWAYYGPGEVVRIRLHHTDIVTFNPDGTYIVHGEHWPTELTFYWLSEITGHKPFRVKRNRWTTPHYMFINSLFVDGMHVQDGIVTNPAPVPPQQVPNAEAKALRKKLTALARTYKQMVLMGETGDPTLDKLANDFDLHLVDCALNPNHEVNLHTYTQLTRGSACSWHGVLASLTQIYVSYVRKHNLLEDET